MTSNSSAPLPFGEWPSPITADRVASSGVGLGGTAVRGSQRWWSELRPAEAGRVVLVCHDTETGITNDKLSAPWSARTRVHEYGGGAWALGQDSVYFNNWDDQRLYRLVDAEGESPRALTPEPSESHGYRYADMRETSDGHWVVCVREDHHVLSGDNPAADCANSIVAVPTDGSQQVVELVAGSDFVAAPRVSLDGSRLSWYAWNHPNMPWDQTTLHVASLTGTVSTLALGETTLISRDATGESIHGSDWLTTGELVYSTDQSGYWNLHRWDPVTGNHEALTNLEDGEIGSPAWVFGTQRWVECSDGTLAVTVTEAASDWLGIVSLDGALPTIPTRVNIPAELGIVTYGSGMAAGGDGSVVALSGSSNSLPRILEISPASGSVSVLREAEDLGIDAGWFSAAERFDFTSEGDRESHAFFYPPTGESNDGQSLGGAEGELPPLVVMGHGGPTAHSSPDLSLKVQYWTSRGVAVVDVNYGGSTGYGREYRNLLNGAWGIVDVDDCVAAADQLAAAGRVDGDRMAIRGGSAGGFTVLRALQVSDSFAAGTSLYGVADLGALAEDTHKFESRYLDGLIGRYPEEKHIYDERSPINHVEDLSCPLLVMQGSEDEVVPPSQSEAIVEAVASKGLPHCYLLFEGEQHGFRQSETIVRSLEAELWFYAKVFGFDQADPIEDLPGAIGFS